MRCYIAMFAALVFGAVGCGDGGSPPDPPAPPPDTNNPCSGLDNCVRPDDDGNCPNGAQKIGKADGVEYCLTAANPPPCEPKCDGATCGAKNGCGGYCAGTCPQGEECTVSLYCERTDDPCAGCHEPRACVDDVCACPPSETIREGWAQCAPVQGAERVRGWLSQDEFCMWQFNEGSPEGSPIFAEAPTPGAEANCSMM